MFNDSMANALIAMAGWDDDKDIFVTHAPKQAKAPTPKAKKVKKPNKGKTNVY